MSHDTNNNHSVNNSDNNGDNQAILQCLQEMRQQQQQLMDRLERMEQASVVQDGKVVYKHNRATTLKLYDQLINAYPAVVDQDYFTKELPKDHDLFNWDDFHFTEGMEYEPPSVLEHAEVKLPETLRKVETFVVSIQRELAKSTRIWDSAAHEICSKNQDQTPFGCNMLACLNTTRIISADIAAKISRFREGLYLDQLDIKHGTSKDRYIVSVGELASRKAATEMLRKTYKVPDKDKDKVKKHDNKTKGKPGSGDKPKDHQAGKSHSGDKSGYKSDGGKSGYKSDGSKSGYKPRNKSGGGSGGKNSDQGNEGGKSD